MIIVKSEPVGVLPLAIIPVQNLRAPLSFQLCSVFADTCAALDPNIEKISAVLTFTSNH